MKTSGIYQLGTTRVMPAYQSSTSFACRIIVSISPCPNGIAHETEESWLLPT